MDGVLRTVTFRRREVQVLRLIADGDSMKQAGRRLGLTRRTVEHYVENARARAENITTKELIAQLVAVGVIIPKQRSARSSGVGGRTAQS